MHPKILKPVKPQIRKKICPCRNVRCAGLRPGRTMLIMIGITVIVVLCWFAFIHDIVIKPINTPTEELKGEALYVRRLADGDLAGAQAALAQMNVDEELHEAAKEGYADTARAILEENPEIVDAPTGTGLTALHVAIKNGHIDVAKVLIEYKANLDTVAGKEFTPLQLAVNANYANNEEMVRLLLETGASVNIKSPKTGATALHIAADRGDPRIVKLLLDFNAQSDVADNARMTPLHYATLKGRDDCAKLLLDNGADVNAKDKQGRTPLAMVVALLESPTEIKGTTPHRLQQVVNVLREYGGQQ